MRRVIVVGLAVCVVAVAVAGAAGEKKGAGEKKRPSEKDFLGIWIEERRESGGKVYDDAGDLLGYQLELKEAGCWLRRGESVYTGLGKARLRTDKEPVWLDLIGGSVKVKVGDKWVEKVSIRPGIAKRDGKKLVWVWAKDWHAADPKDVADYPTRPRSFELKKDDPWEKKTLYPGSGLYDQD